MQHCRSAAPPCDARQPKSCGGAAALVQWRELLACNSALYKSLWGEYCTVCTESREAHTRRSPRTWQRRRRLLLEALIVVVVFRMEVLVLVVGENSS